MLVKVDSSVDQTHCKRSSGGPTGFKAWNKRCYVDPYGGKTYSLYIWTIIFILFRNFCICFSSLPTGYLSITDLFEGIKPFSPVRDKCKQLTTEESKQRTIYYHIIINPRRALRTRMNDNRLADDMRSNNQSTEILIY